MHRYAFVIAFTRFVSISQARSEFKKISFKLGAKFKLPQESGDLSFGGNPDNGLVNLSIKKEDPYITKFDPESLTKRAEATLQIPERTRSFKSELVTSFSNNYSWIHCDFDKATMQQFHYCKNIDVQSGKLITANKKLIKNATVHGNKVMPGFMLYKIADKFQFA